MLFFADVVFSAGVMAVSANVVFFAGVVFPEDAVSSEDAALSLCAFLAFFEDFDAISLCSSSTRSRSSLLRFRVLNDWESPLISISLGSLSASPITASSRFSPPGASKNALTGAPATELPPLVSANLATIPAPNLTSLSKLLALGSPSSSCILSR